MYVISYFLHDFCNNSDRWEHTVFFCIYSGNWDYQLEKIWANRNTKIRVTTHSLCNDFWAEEGFEGQRLKNPNVQAQLSVPGPCAIRICVHTAELCVGTVRTHIWLDPNLQSRC